MKLYLVLEIINGRPILFGFCVIVWVLVALVLTNLNDNPK